MVRYRFQKTENYSVLDNTRDIKSALEGICDAEFISISDFKSELYDKRKIESHKVYVPDKVLLDVNEDLSFSLDSLPVFFNNKGPAPYGVHQIGMLKKVE